MVTRFEVISGAVCLSLIALSLYLVQTKTTLDELTQPATVVSSGATVVSEEVVANAISQTEAEQNNDMKIDDIKVGTGDEAKNGDMVAVHYVGRLDDGTEFDNSHKRGAPIEFTLGAGMVIPGWEEGIAGMQVGGERVLVIPPEKAYGAAGAGGVIPPNATLTFTVELVEIK